MNLDAAQELAARVLDALQPFCKKIAIAGSVRRERAVVNDLDVVLIPAGLDAMNLIAERIEQNWDLVTGSGPHPQNIIYRSRKSGFQLDLFLAHEGTHDLISSTPSNWGAVLLCRTGSKFHNQQLCQAAIGKGLKFAPYIGLCRAGASPAEQTEIVASETEEAIYEALGLSWHEPTQRESLSFVPFVPSVP